MLSFRLLLAVLLLPPVIAAHSASLFEPDWYMLPAVLSVSLLIYASTALYAGIRPGAARFLAGFVLLTPIACYLFTQLLSYELQGSYFNQRFFYHFNVTTLVATWDVFARTFNTFAVWLVAIWLTLLRYANVSFPTSRLPARTVPVLFLVALFADPGLNRSVRISAAHGFFSEDIILEETEWQALRLNPNAVSRQELQASAGKNLLLIYMEGLEKIYTDEAIFPGLTPNLNALSEQGLSLDKLQQMAGTQWTIAGIASSLCGTPLLYNSSVDGNAIDFSNFLVEADCVTDVLASAGYEQIFMGGASTAFADKGTFLTNHGYDRALGREELTPLLDDPEYLGGWGLFDDSLLSLAEQEFVRLADQDSPFNLTLLTVDTHHPDGEVSASCPAYAGADNSILHAVHCTDFLIGNFLDSISSHPEYANTLVVLVSDHLAMPNAAFPLFPEDYERHLYLTILNSEIPLLDQPRANPVDLAPTLLSLLEVEHNTAFLVGKDLTRTRRKAALSDAMRMQKESTIAFINGEIFTP